MGYSDIQIIEIPCGQGGLNYSKSISGYPVQDLRYCDNLTYEDDTWQKEGGATKINTTALTDSPTVTGLHDFWTNSSTQIKIAATNDGKIVSFTTTGIVNTLATGLGIDRQTVFIEGYGEGSTRKLFAFNGYDSPQVTSDGVTAMGIANPPADWSGTNQPTAGTRHNNRMWAWGNLNYPHMVYYSRSEDNEDFTGYETTTETEIKGSANTDSENEDAVAEPTNGAYVSAYTAVAAGAWTHGTLTNPDINRNVCITIKNDSGGALNLYEGEMTFTVTGTHNSSPREENIRITSTAANKAVADGAYRYVYGSKPFDTVTNITLDNVSDNGLKIGAGLGSKIWLSEGLANASYADIISATLNSTSLDPYDRVDGTYYTFNFGDVTDDDDIEIQYLAHSGAGIFNVYPGEGERIVAGFSFAGYLFLWKYPRGIYYIDDSSPNSDNWTVKRLTQAVGMSGPLGEAQIENDILFVSSDGLPHSLSTIQEYGDAKSSALFPEKIGGFIREKLNIDRLDHAVARYYPTKREWQLACTGKGYTYNNYRVIIDLHDIQNPRYRFSTRDECEAMSLVKDSENIDRLMVGDRSGFIRMIDTSSRNKDGTGYTARFETADVELFPKGTRRGNLQYVEVVFRPTGSHDLVLDIYLDGSYSQTVSVNMGSGTGGQLDSFVLGTDTLGGGNVLNTRKRIVGDTHRVRILGHNSGLNESFSVASILIGYIPGNERAIS